MDGGGEESMLCSPEEQRNGHSIFMHWHPPSLSLRLTVFE